MVTYEHVNKYQNIHQSVFAFRTLLNYVLQALANKQLYYCSESICLSYSYVYWCIHGYDVINKHQNITSCVQASVLCDEINMSFVIFLPYKPQ